MNGEWVKIHSAPFEYEVEVLKSMLENEGVPAFVINKKDSAYISIGEVELYTKKDSVLKAVKLVKKALENE